MSQVKQALSHFLSFCFFRRSCERGLILKQILMKDDESCSIRCVERWIERPRHRTQNKRGRMMDRMWGSKMFEVLAAAAKQQQA